ncbi:uncharacterized protein LOC106941512 [Poecilia latipinna]|uniref:uncharacterized protein LOC106941512 n=1 Tax=Poecilia latipinna TaxID=48699 RepID=UPI00072EA686|nr:PREDICTED: uncharacterized protein LOC106941512 [Poecilia latipinna]
MLPPSHRNETITQRFSAVSAVTPPVPVSVVEEQRVGEWGRKEQREEEKHIYYENLYTGAMGPSSSLESFLLFLWISGICGGLAQAQLMKKDNCTNYELVIERVFSVPGDAAMLNSTLLSQDVFNFTAVPFNITWFSAKTGQEMRNETGRILVLQETLWFLNTTLDDDGEYLAIVRTPSQCYMQTAKLVMDRPVAGECGRPRKDSRNVETNVVCPLNNYIHKLKTYGMDVSVNWYKQETKSYIFNFFLFSDKYSLVPQVHKPENEIIKEAKGSNLTKSCLVFVPGAGIPFVDVIWLVENKVMFDSEPSDRIYTSDLRSWTQDEPKGVWLERLLLFSELKEEDFYLNYTCRVFSSRGYPDGYFTLLPAGKACGYQIFLWCSTVHYIA